MSFTATYQITPPSGQWDVGDSGNYSVAIEAKQIFDIAGNSMQAAALGNFVVDLSYSTYLPLALNQ